MKCGVLQRKEIASVSIFTNKISRGRIYVFTHNQFYGNHHQIISFKLPFPYAFSLELKFNESIDNKIKTNLTESVGAAPLYSHSKRPITVIYNVYSKHWFRFLLEFHKFSFNISTKWQLKFDEREDERNQKKKIRKNWATNNLKKIENL